MKGKLVILVLTLQTVWLLGTAARQEQLLHKGRVIMLDTRPVDPRDLLRGDYVRLNYQIGNVPFRLFDPPLKISPANGTKIYVTLVPSGTNQFWVLRRGSLDPLTPGTNEVLLCGRNVPPWMGGIDTVQVTYGIEQFYVAEGTGNPRGKLTAEVAVSPSGHAGLKDVLVDGRPYQEVMGK